MSARCQKLHAPRCLLLVFIIVGLLLLRNAAASAQTLTGAVLFAADESGAYDGYDYWNTGGGPASRVFFRQDGKWINDADFAIHVPMTPGLHKLRFYAEPVNSKKRFGLNLFFDGDAKTPGISVFAAAASKDETPPFAEIRGKTMRLDTQATAGAGTLVYKRNNVAVEVVAYRIAAPDVEHLDLVSRSGTLPNGTEDLVGTLTLKVSGGAAKGAGSAPQPQAPPIKAKAEDKIIFVSNREGLRSIYTMDAEGKSIAPMLTEGHAVEQDPAWSPNRKQIAFVAIEGDADAPKWSIYITNATLGDQLVTDRFVYESKSGSAIFGPTWSPDGSTLFFTESSNTPGSPFHMVKLNIKNKGVKTLGNGLLPSISPDGKALLYTSLEFDAARKAAVFSLKQMNIDETNKRTMVKNGLGGSWSPDGKSIAFINSEGALTVVKADGTERRMILPASPQYMFCRPIWSCDGKRVYFNRIDLHKPGVSTSDICAIDLDGKNFKRLTDEKSDNVLGDGTPFFAVLKQGAEKARAHKSHQP